MPLPWLIGAAVVAGVAAIVASSDDDKPSNNNSNNNGDEERRRQAAERERKERERNEKKAAIKQEFDQRIQQAYQEMKVALPSLVAVHWVGKSVLTLSRKGSNLSELVSAISKTSPYKFMQDVDLFKKLYEVDAKPTAKMMNTIKDIDLLEKVLKSLIQSIKELS